MKKIFLFLAILVAASAEITRLPDEFYVTERFFSLTSTFDVSTEIECFATARKHFFSFTANYDLEDIHQQPIAHAASRFFSWGTVADVTDHQNNKIGWIEEAIFQLFTWTEYKIFNHLNHLTAIARMNFWGTEFELSHPDNPSEIYATISRPFLRFLRDHWTVRIKNYSIFEQGIIDPRLLILLAIYQTDKENRDKLRNELIEELEE